MIKKNSKVNEISNMRANMQIKAWRDNRHDRHERHWLINRFFPAASV